MFIWNLYIKIQNTILYGRKGCKLFHTCVRVCWKCICVYTYMFAPILSRVHHAWSMFSTPNTLWIYSCLCTCKQFTRRRYKYIKLRGRFKWVSKFYILMRLWHPLWPYCSGSKYPQDKITLAEKTISWVNRLSYTVSRSTILMIDLSFMSWRYI